MTPWFRDEKTTFPEKSKGNSDEAKSALDEEPDGNSNIAALGLQPLSVEEQPPDFLDDVLKKQDSVSEVTAPNPEDQYWGFRDKFLKEAQKLNHPDQFEKDAIIAALEKKNNFTEWQNSIQQTGLHYKGSGKIARAIEVYLHGDGDYEKWRQWKYPNDNGNKPSSRPLKLTPAQIERIKELDNE